MKMRIGASVRSKPGSKLEIRTGLGDCNGLALIEYAGIFPSSQDVGLVMHR